MKKGISVTGMLAMLLVLSTLSAFAAREQWSTYVTPEYVGKVEETQRWFHPRLSFQVEYDDNIVLVPSNEAEDVIFTTTPGFLVIYPFAGGDHLFTTDYHLDWAKFVDFDDQDYDNHYLLTGLDLSYPDFYIRTSNDFRKTSLRSGTEFTERVKRFEDTFSLDAGVDTWNKLSVEGGYDFNLVSYEDDAFETLDRKDHILSGTAFYQVTPKSKALLEYNHSFITYDETDTRDGDYDQVRAGLTGDILSKLIGTVKGGFQDRRYDDSDQDWSSAVFHVSLVHTWSPHTSFTLLYERSAAESVYSVNNFYSLDNITLTWNQVLFFERLNGKFRAAFQNNEYPEPTTEGGITQERDDDILDLTVEVNYLIKDWLVTGAEYHYIDRDSNFGIFDYVDNRVLWKISALF